MFNPLTAITGLFSAAKSITKTVFHKTNSTADAQNSIIHTNNTIKENASHGGKLAILIFIAVFGDLFIVLFSHFIVALTAWPTMDFKEYNDLVYNNAVDFFNMLRELPEPLQYTLASFLAAATGTGTYVAAKNSPNRMLKKISALPNKLIANRTGSNCVKLAHKSTLSNEGFKAKFYMCTAGYITIGYGFKVFATNSMSDEEKDKFLKLTAKAKYNKTQEQHEQDVKSILDDLEAKYCNQEYWDNITDECKAVVLELCYWLGSTKFRRFAKANRALKKLDMGEFKVQLMDSKIGKGLQGKGVQDRMVRLCASID